ncbi:MAG: FtsX-like permease family protein [Demequina sp.]|uniref:FtsX-like permease family protein n=1 Tax=Demequina sp. TaxID=2050685 RepID=UPI003A892567
MRPLAPARRAATAARIAWRDLRKDPRQGALVASLVALPAAVLMASGVVGASQQPTDAQRIAVQLGANEAWVQVVGPPGSQVIQSSVDPSMMVMEDPEQGAEESATQERSVAELLPPGTRTIDLTAAQVLVTHDDAAGSFDAVVGPAWDPSFVGMFTVVEGTTPGDGEVMVSTDLAERWSLAPGDTIGVGTQGDARTVAGVIDAPLSFAREIVFGTAESLAPGLDSRAGGEGTLTYLPDLELDWEAVQALNADGVAAYSRTVAQNPPAEYLNASNANWPGQGDSGLGSGAIIGAGLGLLEVVLLAGAAFAVSMRRRQERLALLAATGASRGALVSVGLFHGALLGLAGGVIGVPVGLGIGVAWLEVIDRWGDGYTQTWGLHVAWWQAAAILAFTTFAGAVAALVPAIASARLDVMAALRGSRKPAKPRRWPAVTGAVLLVAAAVALVFAVHLRSVAWETPVADLYAVETRAAQVTLAGVLLLFIAFIALTPAVLRCAARALGSASLGARLASRDAARHTGRTVPVIAAITVTVLIAGNVVLDTFRHIDAWAAETSGVAQQGDAFAPLESWAYEGDTEVRVLGDAEALTARAQEAFPDLEAIAIDQAANAWDLASGDARSSVIRYPEESLCPAWDEQAQWYDENALTKRERAQDPRCAEESGSTVYGIAVGGADEFAYIAGRPASEREREVLAAGGGVAFRPLLVGADAAEGSEGTVTIETWLVEDEGGPGTGGEPLVAAEVPAIVAEPAFWVSNYSMLLSPEAAAAAGAEVIPGTLYLHRDAGFTEFEEDQLESALMREGEWHAWVQRPLDRGEGLIAWGSLIATLLVAGAAAGLSLGLARADARRDDLTLASLGASPRLSRSVAAWQGGILVGLAVGIGMTGAVVLDVIRAMSDTTLAPFAWAVFAIAVVVPPLVVAGLAWLMTKPAKPVHYRLAA